MARFYVNIEGNRGPASRMGTEKSGIFSHTRGWNVGIKVLGHVNDAGEDEFDVWLTSGSTGAKSSKLIGTFTRASLEA
jgi:hypothetical protein